ncbi:MAG: alpha/beta fold hydrolase [Acidobacteriota bacterium]|nr:alpha/beta fold hydrolase [Acidobacteriota bacterium]
METLMFISSSTKEVSVTVSPFSAAAVRVFLSEVAQVFADKPFEPHPVFRGGHAQTLASFAWPRRFRLRAPGDETRLFEVAPNTRVLAHCRWHDNRAAHPTIVLWHGIEGSSDAVYMFATAQKAFRAGFNVVRMNLRNCGGTEHLTPTLYHGGLSEDLRAVVRELIERDGLSRLFLIGFSLGGNMVLKLAGEYGEHPPKEIIAGSAISPSIDLDASANSICQRSNWVYHRDFVRRLKNRIRLKGKLYPEVYDTSEIHLIRTIREFDERFTAVAHGFANAADYYDKASALRVMDKIRVPTLIIHAQDDPFIPFAPLRDPSVGANPYILLLGPERGGHVAFVAAAANEEDRFWAENRVLEFCRMANATL